MGLGLGYEEAFAAVGGVDVEGDPLEQGVDGCEGFAPAFEPGGFEALDDVEGRELAEGGEAYG